MCMPNIYFWEPRHQSHGTLQAVLPWDHCERVIGPASATHLGAQFPTDSVNDSGTLVILYVRPDEASDQWLSGFRLNTDAATVHDAINCDTTPPSSAPRTKAF